MKAISINWQSICEKKFSIRVLRPLWLTLPFLPCLAPLFNLSSLLYSGAILFIFIYFFPAMVVIFACSFLILLPDWFDPVLKVGAGLICIGYCGVIAYCTDQKLRKKTTKLSIKSVLSIYSAIMIPFLLLVLAAAGFPPSNEMPIYQLKNQQHLIQDIKTFRDEYQFIDTQYFILISYNEGFIEYCIKTFDLASYPVNDIPKPFWNQYILWWQPRKHSDARAYISANFDFFQRGADSDHYFIYVMPNDQICYIWYKQNF